MNYSLTMRILLFMELALDLLRVEELKQVWLEVKTRKWLKMGEW